MNRPKVWAARAILAIILATSGAVIFLSADNESADAPPDEYQPVQVTVPADYLLDNGEIADEWPEDPLEAEKIEQALLEQGYFREDVPLSFMDQDFLHTACAESGVPYALALAVIEKETGFRNVVGDDGNSTGYMQVQEKWHWDRMERLGVDDLSNPFGNMRVGCDFLAELLGKYSLEEALTAYNSGKPGKSEYAQKVISYYEKWKELVGDEVSGIKG